MYEGSSVGEGADKESPSLEESGREAEAVGDEACTEVIAPSPKSAEKSRSSI